MEYLAKKFNHPGGYRVAVFGGSFDPPTLGHQSVIEQLAPVIDEVVLIPSLAHAFGKNLTDYATRLVMLALFIEDVCEQYPCFKNKIQVLNIEPELANLHSTGYVYTYDVLEKVEKLYQEQHAEIGFVIGPDLAIPEVFNRFYRAKEIKNRWPILVVEQKLAIRSTDIRHDIAEQMLTTSSENFEHQFQNRLSRRVMEDIFVHKKYFPRVVFGQIKIKLDLAIFSVQNNNLCILVKKAAPGELPYALINPEKDERLENALNRSILDQLGHLPSYYEQVITQGGRKNHTNDWILNITYFCLTPILSLNSLTNTWVKVKDLISEEVSQCVERLKNKASYTSIPCYLALEPFTLSDLQKIYEIALGYKLEKKSFRRRFIESGLLEDTGQIRKANHRPAQLYRLSRRHHLSNDSPYYFTRVIEGSRS